MTRAELDAAWDEVYWLMVDRARRRVQHLGDDAVQQAYVLMLEGGTYTHQDPVQAKVWIWWKVKRQIDRVRKTEQLHAHTAVDEGIDEAFDTMADDES
jgi:hypothetical protein